MSTLPTPVKRVGILIATFLSARAGFAVDTLPYSTRTHPYSTEDTTAQGDPRTVGMAGATVGIADTAINATDNPAGLAMTINLGDLNFASNHVHDSSLQNYDQPVIVDSFGTAISPYPWGFGLTVINPYREGQPYLLPSAAGEQGSLMLSTQEFHMNAARVLLDNRLALGMSLRFGGADETITQGVTQTSSSVAIGATWGAMVRLDDRVLIGASYVTPMTYTFGGAFQPASFPGFYQNIYSPGRWNLGVGWIPNRYFRAGASLTLIGTTPGAALLRDDSILVGSAVTLEPRAGFSYVFADYESFAGSVFAGTYLEPGRAQGNPTRLHGTTGFELKPWLLVVGAAIDLSAGYNNTLIGVGIDVLKTMEKLELVPKLPVPPHRGLISDPLHRSEEGLPRPLVTNWRPQGAQIDPVQIMIDLPRKIENKIDEIARPSTDPAEPKVPPPPTRKKPAHPKKKQRKKKRHEEVMDEPQE